MLYSPGYQPSPAPAYIPVPKTCPNCNRGKVEGNPDGQPDRYACFNCGHEWNERDRQMKLAQERIDERKRELERLRREWAEREIRLAPTGARR